MDIAQKLMHGVQNANAAARQALAQSSELKSQLSQQIKATQELQEALSRVQVRTSGGDPGIQRVENIPGQRIPFDMLVDISLPSGSVAVRQGSVPVPQDGPFVAVARSFHLMSAVSAVYTDPDLGTESRFSGRSNGRFRPIHSAWDLNDGHPIITTYMQDAFPGSGAPHTPSPSSQSSFRTMQGDFRVTFRTAGSGWPRQNLSVPSTMWTTAINEPWMLGALDVFERSEVLEFNILPLHTNNPAAGNVSGFAAANTNFPFLASQYDAVEGIVDVADLDAGSTDPVVRTFDAIATIGFHGYLIKNQPGLAAGM